MKDLEKAKSMSQPQSVIPRIDEEHIKITNEEQLVVRRQCWCL